MRCGSVGRYEEMEEGVIDAGWLSKRGAIVKAWRRRWFVLTGTTFAYYLDSDMKRARRMLPLWRLVRVRGMSHRSGAFPARTQNHAPRNHAQASMHSTRRCGGVVVSNNHTVWLSSLLLSGAQPFSTHTAPPYPPPLLLSLAMQVYEGSTPSRLLLDTSLPRTFDIEAESVEEAMGWRESLAAAMHRYDTVNKAMAAKHAGDVRTTAIQTLCTSRLCASHDHRTGVRFVCLPPPPLPPA
jgi:hypothetical protein